MNSNSAFTGSYTENPFWYRQFDLRQIRLLRGGQSTVDFDTADNCRLYVLTMKAMKFQDDIIPIDNFKDRHVLVFELILMQDATVNCHYPELVGEPQRLKLNFTFPLEHVTEFSVLGDRMSLDAVDTFRVFEKIISNGKCFSPTNIQSYPTTQVSVPWIIFSDFVLTFDNDTFAFINTQPSNMQGQFWIMNTQFRH